MMTLVQWEKGKKKRERKERERERKGGRGGIKKRRMDTQSDPTVQPLIR